MRLVATQSAGGLRSPLGTLDGWPMRLALRSRPRRLSMCRACRGVSPSSGSRRRSFTERRPGPIDRSRQRPSHEPRSRRWRRSPPTWAPVRIDGSARAHTPGQRPPPTPARDATAGLAAARAHGTVRRRRGSASTTTTGADSVRRPRRSKFRRAASTRAHAQRYERRAPPDESPDRLTTDPGSTA